MQRFPGDVTLRRTLLDVYRLFPLTKASRLQIYEDLLTRAELKNVGW